MFVYLNNCGRSRLVFDPTHPDFLNVDWSDFYQGARYGIITNSLDLICSSVKLNLFDDTSHAVNVATNMMYYGFLILNRNVPIIFYSTKYNMIESAVFREWFLSLI